MLVAITKCAWLWEEELGGSFPAPLTLRTCSTAWGLSRIACCLLHQSNMTYISPHLLPLSLQIGSLLSTWLPSQEMNILKILLFAILQRIYKMLSMCQSVLLMVSLFYMPGLPGLELSD